MLTRLGDLPTTWFPIDDTPPHVEVGRARITEGDRILARMLGIPVGQIMAERAADDIPEW